LELVTYSEQLLTLVIRAVTKYLHLLVKPILKSLGPVTGLTCMNEQAGSTNYHS